SAMTRLMELGVPAYVVASSVLGVLAQRLTRRLCECRRPGAASSAQPAGCEACRFTGFRGRVGIYELLRMTSRVRGAVIGRGGDDEVRRAAGAQGFTTLFADGQAKAARGVTTPEEIRRVAPPDEVEDLAEPTRARRGTTRVLLVDDDDALRDVVGET